MDKLVWNVYRHDINGKKIEIYNVFNHGSFNNDVAQLTTERLNYNGFSEKLRRIAQYYFWSKAEYETVITSWPPHIDNEEINRIMSNREKHTTYAYYVNLDVGSKIDIYEQLMLNWDKFAYYVWWNTSQSIMKEATYEK